MIFAIVTQVAGGKSVGLLASLFRRPAAVRNRTDLVNHLIRKHGFQRYLEIGVRHPKHNFNKITAPHKDGVDPSPRGRISHTMTSDDFFARLRHDPNHPPYDVILVDGLHLAEQVERDIVNGLAHLSPGGYIVVHDCNPPTEDAQTDDYDGKKDWNGTVWKAWAKLRATRPDLSMWVVDADQGCGVIRRGRQTCFPLPKELHDASRLAYGYLVEHRQALLNLISVQDFLALE
jgi:hypothetical protein